MIVKKDFRFGPDSCSLGEKLVKCLYMHYLQHSFLIRRSFSLLIHEQMTVILRKDMLCYWNLEFS